MSGSIFIYDGSKYSNKEPSVSVELHPGGYAIKFDSIIAIDNFILQLEDLRKKMEDADMFLDILNVIS